jgi:hypothetical protein
VENLPEENQGNISPPPSPVSGGVEGERKKMKELARQARSQVENLPEENQGNISPPPSPVSGGVEGERKKMKEEADRARRLASAMLSPEDTGDILPRRSAAGKGRITLPPLELPKGKGKKKNLSESLVPENLPRSQELSSGDNVSEKISKTSAMSPDEVVFTFVTCSFFWGRDPSGKTVELLPPPSTINDPKGAREWLRKNSDKILKVSCTGSQFAEIPTEIGLLTNLRVLEVKDSYLATLPDQMANLKNLTELDLSGNFLLREIPEKFFSSLDKLTKVRLAHCHLQKLPESLGNLPQLTTLDVSGNMLAELPKSLRNHKSLTSLNIDETFIKELHFNEFSQLKAISLRKTPINFHNLSELQNLEKLRIGDDAQLEGMTLQTLVKQVSRLPPSVKLIFSDMWKYQIEKYMKEIG